jgi:hypothetical protein
VDGEKHANGRREVQHETTTESSRRSTCASNRSSTSTDRAP